MGIVVARQGRLGNSMFQFSFGLAASRNLHTSFQFDCTDLREYFTLDGYDRLLPRLGRRLGFGLSQALRSFETIEFSSDHDSPDDVRSRLGDMKFYRGFFQSEEYFDTSRDAVREAFTFLPQIATEFQRRYGAFTDEGYTCVHVRRTDYLSWRDGVALPWSYYRRCLDLVPPGPTVFVSDDIQAVKDEFGGRSDTYFETNDPGVDLMLLRNASAVVSSNSSFSWWGSWLGRPGRLVLAPKYWLGFKGRHEVPLKVVVPGWTKIDVPGDED
jgi:hypothetical protein